MMQPNYDQASLFSQNRTLLENTAFPSKGEGNKNLLVAFMTITDYSNLLFDPEVNLVTDITEKFIQNVMLLDFNHIVRALTDYEKTEKRSFREVRELMDGALKDLYTAFLSFSGKKSVVRVGALLSCRDRIRQAYVLLEYLKASDPIPSSRTMQENAADKDQRLENWVNQVLSKIEDGTDFIPTDSKPPEKQKPADVDDVVFTAIFPRESSVEQWHSLLVYAHLTSAIEKVSKDAEHFKDELLVPREINLASSTRLARGTEITIIPACDEIEFNPSRISIKWLEDYQLTYFRFRASKAHMNAEIKCQVDIYVGPIIIGTLELPFLFKSKQYLSRQKNEVHGSMYHQEDIFVSYSHQDTAIALACKKAYEALGFNVLIDIDTLRSGQIWKDELKRMIKKASIFQLFWSQNSSQSEYCKTEWQFALRCKKGTGFIRPVYWKKPLPNPPQELTKFHFAYVEFMRSQD